MRTATDHMPKLPSRGGDTVVAGPRPTDAVGGALAFAFTLNRNVPADLATVLRQLDSIG